MYPKSRDLTLSVFFVFLDFQLHFNSNKRITAPNQNSRLSTYNNTTLIQTVSISLLVDFEMSAVLVSHNSHHFAVFSGWHPLIQSGLSVFHSFHQTIYKERAKIVFTKIFQCYPNVFISQMSES